MDKQKACEAIHNLGGCEATEEWSKGYDAGITAALDAIEKIPDTDNNADLISRSELQSEIAKGVGECRIRAFEPSVNCILQIIHRLPAADVQPVVDTENMATVSAEFICKKCGIYLIDYSKVVMDEDNDGYIDEQHYEYEPKFCPECGAKVKDGDAE